VDLLIHHYIVVILKHIHIMYSVKSDPGLLVKQNAFIVCSWSGRGIWTRAFVAWQVLSVSASFYEVHSTCPMSKTSYWTGYWYFSSLGLLLYLRVMTRWKKNDTSNLARRRLQRLRFRGNLRFKVNSAKVFDRCAYHDGVYIKSCGFSDTICSNVHVRARRQPLNYSTLQ